MTRKALCGGHDTLDTLLHRHQCIRQAFQLRQNMQVSNACLPTALQARQHSTRVANLTHGAKTTHEHAETTLRHRLPRLLVAHHTLERWRIVVADSSFLFLLFLFFNL